MPALLRGAGSAQRPAPPLLAVVAAPPLLAPAASIMADGVAAKFEGMTGEQVKASVYGYAGDLNDDKISPEEMAGIVEAAAQRLDEPQKQSLEALLRMKVDEDFVDDVVAPLKK